MVLVEAWFDRTAWRHRWRGKNAVTKYSDSYVYAERTQLQFSDNIPRMLCNFSCPSNGSATVINWTHGLVMTLLRYAVVITSLLIPHRVLFRSRPRYVILIYKSKFIIQVLILRPLTCRACSGNVAWCDFLRNKLQKIPYYLKCI